MIDQEQFLALKGNYRYIEHRLCASIALVKSAMQERNPDGSTKRGPKSQQRLSYELPAQECHDLVALLEDLDDRLRSMFNPRIRPDLRKVNALS